MTLSLVIGGTRSGKSAHAERIAGASERPVRYLATADPSDASMRERIARHAARRPAAWTTVLAREPLGALVDPGAVTLLDGLGVWLAGALHRGVDVAGEIDGLIAAARHAELIIVAEEAGQGLLPGDGISRAWLDSLGEATQRLAAAASRVELVVAGRPLRLGGTLAAVPDALRDHGDTMVSPGDHDHAVNVLAPGPPAWLTDALAGALASESGGYPREAAASAATAVLHGRSPEEIVPTNGAAEALWLLGPALRPRLAALVLPGFTEAEAGLRIHDIALTRVLRDPGDDFRLDPAAVPADADLVILGNPVSPSGTLDPADAVLALRRPGRTVVVDEAFMSMVPGEPSSLAHGAPDDVIVVRSLTKLLSIPGLRAGYAIASPPLAGALRAARPPWAANALALAAMQASADHPAAVAALAERAREEGEDLARRISRIPGVRTWPSVTNFRLIEVPDGPRVLAALRARAIAVRPAGSFPGLGTNHLRLTARDPTANARLAAALAEALG